MVGFRQPLGELVPSGNEVFMPRTPVTAVTPETNVIDLYAVGTDERVYRSRWDTAGWHDWYAHGTVTFDQRTPITAVTHSPTPQQVHLFAVALDGSVQISRSAVGPSEWSPVGRRGLCSAHTRRCPCSNP